MFKANISMEETKCNGKCPVHHWGKWKLRVIIALKEVNKRFNDPNVAQQAYRSRCSPRKGQLFQHLRMIQGPIGSNPRRSPQGHCS